MLKPVLEEFDPARRPLLFLSGILIYCCAEISTADKPKEFGQLR